MDYFGVTASKEGKTLLKELEDYLGSHFTGSLWLWPGSRLDSGVSATELWIEVVLKAESEASLTEDLLPNLIEKLKKFKSSEIKIKKLLKNITRENLIANLDEKTYRYFVTLSKETLPKDHDAFVDFSESFDFLEWARWVKFFEGKHHFKAFSIRTKPDAIMEREISSASVFKLSDIEKSMSKTQRATLEWLGIKEEYYQNMLVVEIKGTGFLRGQVRMMVGALLKLSKKELTEENFLLALKGQGNFKAGFKVPSHGLVLWSSELKNQSLPILLDLDSQQG